MSILNSYRKVTSAKAQRFAWQQPDALKKWFKPKREEFDASPEL